MVSFSCENCGDVLTKKKLDGHRNQCRGASFTCLDCMVHFRGTDYHTHTSCISEAQKYQGHMYRGDKKANKGEKRRSAMPGSVTDSHSQAIVPHKHAYVEDAPEGDETNAVAVIDVPPRAPTPPPANEALPSNVNVFDFLVQDATPTGDRKKLDAPNGGHMVEETRHHANGDSQYSQYSSGDGSFYAHHGYSYGQAPVQPGLDRYDSWQNLTESQQSQGMLPPPPYVTPGPKRDRKEKLRSEKSDKKRKRAEDLDLSSVKRPSSRGDELMSDVPPVSSAGRVLHSGLTGGLSRLVTDPEFYEDRIDAGPTPITPLKRSKREKNRDTKDEHRKSSYASKSTTASKPSSSKHANDKRTHRSLSKDHESHSSKHRHHRQRRDSSSSADDRHRTAQKAIEYPGRSGSVQPTSSNQVVTYNSNAELFLSFIHKGPESDRGCSINKVLKRYHREQDVRGDEKEDYDKDLWKSLRLKRNDRGEIVVFV